MAFKAAALLVSFLVLASLSFSVAIFPKRNKFSEWNPIQLETTPLNLASKPRLSHNLNVFQYDIQIQPYFPATGVIYDQSRNFTFDGTSQVTFQMLSTAVSISFDAYNLDIYALSLFDSNGIHQQLASANFENATNRYTVTPIQFLQGNQNYTLSFGYTGKINPYDEGGLFYSTYVNSDGTRGNIYATFFELGDGARSVYPCFDDPHFKAVFNLTVIYPKGLVAIANTMPDATADAGNGYQSTRFKITQRMSTYLVAFAIGELVSKETKTFDGITVRAFGWKGTENFLDEAVATSKTCVEVMTNFTAFKFPLEKLDHLAVPHFAAGGMENWGMIVYAAELVFYDSRQDTTSTRYMGIDVRCHEIAHQWFGDLVTADWWSEIMLHESFAAYFEDYALIAGWPEQAEYLDPAYIASSIEDGFNSDGNNSHPVITQDGTFDGVVYAKGSGLLRMLSSLLSPAVFQAGLQNYLKKYQFSTATHSQLFEAMNEIVGTIDSLTDWCNGNLNVTKFMEPWLIQPHYPVLTVTYDPTSHSYFVDQRPFIPKNQLYPQGFTYAWPIPFKARQISDPAPKQYWSNRYYRCNINYEEDASSLPGIPIPAKNDEPLIVNEDSEVFARVQYDDFTFNKIIDGLNNEYFQLSSKTLIRMINDELAIVRRDEQFTQQSSYLRAMKLVAAALMNNNTNSAAVFSSAQSLIDEMVRLGIDRAERELYENYFQTILTNFYRFTSWESSGTDWNENILRERLFYYSILFNIEDARRRASFNFQQLYAKCGTDASWLTCNDVHTDLRAALYCGAVINDNGTIFTNIIAILQRVQQDPSPSRQEVRALKQGLACSKHPNNIRKFVAMSLSPGQIGQPTDIGYLGRNPVASDVIYQMMNDSMGIIESDPNGFQYALTTMTYNWYTPKRIQQLEQLFPLLSARQNATFIPVYNEILRKSPYYQATYLEITRHLYDSYYPIGFTPWTRRLLTPVQPLTYQLSVLPYIPNLSFSYPADRNFTYDANVTITLQPTADITELRLNSHRHVIESYSVLNLDTNTTLAVNSVTRDFANAIIILTMTNSIPAGSMIQVCFNYSGFIFEQTPNEGTLSNYDYLLADGRKSWIFATDFEGGPSTRSLAPCFDEPAYKAKWQVTVIYPGEFLALSNTLEESTINLNNGLLQTTFKQTNLMSSYLLALTIGHYSCLKGVSTVDRRLVRICTWTGMESLGQNALNFAIDAVDHMSKTLSTPMPLEKFDILALPQYSGYSAGAMENWGLVIAGYYDVLYHPDYSTQAQLENIQNTVTHELAHHWFGDLVTLDWWTHIFLNEGFATYWPPEILLAKSPEQKNSYLYVKFAIHENGISLDDNPASALPVVPSPNDLGDSFCLFCGQSYNKAGSIINMLRHAFDDDEVFYSGLTDYLKAWSFKNPSDLSLWATLDSTAQSNQTDGWYGNYLNVTTVMLPYTYQWSTPYIRIISAGNGVFTIGQNPAVNTASLPFTPYEYQWNIPFRYQINGTAISNVQYLVSPSTSLNLNVAPTTPVIFNPQAQSHARVLYDDASWSPIQATFISNPSLIDEVSRAQILSDTWAFVQSKKVQWSRFLNLTVYLQQETSPLVWRQVIRGGSWIQTLFHRFRYQPTVYSNLKVYLATISSGMPTPNFTLTQDWSVNTANALMVDLKCRVGDNTCLVRTKATFANFIQQCQTSAYGTGKCNPVPSDFRGAQFCYGLTQSSKDFDTIFSIFQWWQANPPANDYFPQDSENLLNALSCSQDPGVVNDLITATLNGTIPSRFLQYVANNDNSGSMLSNYLAINQGKVLNSPLFNQFITQMITDWSTDSQLNYIQSFAANAPLSQSQKDMVQKAIAAVESLQTWLFAEGTAVSQWLASFVASLN